MKTIFCYCEKSDTIRTLPENYLVAYRQDRRWVVDCDSAVTEKMAIKAFTAVHCNHDVRWGSGLHFLAAITL